MIQFDTRFYTMSARKSTSRTMSRFNNWRDDYENEQSSGSTELFRSRVEAETYKNKYKDIKEENEKLKEEVKMLRERLGIIAATTNLLLPIASIIPSAVQIPQNHYSLKRKIVSRSPTPPVRTKVEVFKKEEEEDYEEEEEEKYYIPQKLQPKLILEKITVAKKRRGRPPAVEPKEPEPESPESEERSNDTPINHDDLPIFKADSRFPEITQGFLQECHETAEGKIPLAIKTPELEFRDRIFVRLIFNAIYEVSELIGRCAVGKFRSSGHNRYGVEIDPRKKRFIREKLRERLDVIDPENVEERSKQTMLNKWFAALIKNRITTAGSKSRHDNHIDMDMDNNKIKNERTTVYNDDTVFEIFDEPTFEDEDDESEIIFEDDVEVEVYPKRENII